MAALQLLGMERPFQGVASCPAPEKSHTLPRPIVVSRMMIPSENTTAGASDWSGAFSAVAEQMYAVLKACPRRALLACSTVNPRHPLPLDHLELVATVTGSSACALDYQPSMAKRIKAFSRSLAFAALVTIRIAYVRARFHTKIRALLREPASVVMKTWFFGPPSGNGPDFYFGRLPNLLQANGMSYVLVGGNLGTGSATCFARSLLDSGRHAIPELALVRLWAPLAILADQILTSFSLTKLAKNSHNPLFSAVASRASLECLRPATFSHALHYYTAKRAVEIWRPKAYATLYEGQPWEKVAWLGAKNADPACRTMGYQHAVVMPHSLGLIAPHVDGWEFPAPDIVFGLGDATIALMEGGHRALGTTFMTLGSFRRTSEKQQQASPSPTRRVVLVVPEGFMEEAVLLFERAAEAAIAMPDYRFVFRCHPQLPFDRIRSHLSNDIAALPNVEISDRVAIEDDFARSSVVLYRGSSVVLYAVLAGLKPYYFNEPGMPYVDPLYQLGCWRESVDSVGKLADSLRHYAQMDAERILTEWTSAKVFCNDYASPVNELDVTEAINFLTGMC